MLSEARAAGSPERPNGERSAERTPSAAPSYRLWVKVALCLVALDVLLFRIGILWTMTPNFGGGLGGENWRYLFAAASEFETQRPALGKTEAVGSSVVIFGANEALINDRLR